MSSYDYKEPFDLLGFIIGIAMIVGLIFGIHHMWVSAAGPHVPTEEEICVSKNGKWIYSDDGPDFCVKKDSLIDTSTP